MREILLDYLKSCTKEKPLNRYEAAERLNVTERTVRGLITVLRTEGIRVCSDSSGKGYWIAKTTAEYERFRAEYGSRATKIFRTIKAMDEATEGQMSM